MQHQPPKSVPNKAKQRRYFTYGTCAKIAGGWSLTGTAKNPSKQAATTYRVTVYFTTSRGTVQDYSQINVKVPAGKTSKWTASKKFKAVSGTRCVVTGFASVK